MNYKDQLLEIINKNQDYGATYAKSQMDERKTYIYETPNSVLADSILADGWIKPPCNVGDKVYSMGIFTGQIIESVVTSIIYSDDNVFLHLENETAVDVLQQLGKTVFLTKDELKEVFKEKIIEQ